MLTPIFQETDVIRIGDTYLRTYNTGTLDTSQMTPRVRMFKRVDGSAMDQPLFARKKRDNGGDDPYNFALCIPFATTNVMSTEAMYVLTVSFDDGAGNSIPHGSITLSVTQGEAHE